MIYSLNSYSEHNYIILNHKIMEESKIYYSPTVILLFYLKLKIKNYEIVLLYSKDTTLSKELSQSH